MSRAALLLGLCMFSAVSVSAELISLRDPRVNDRITPNMRSDYVSISGDGRFVAFSSAASDIVTSDVNGRSDVFLFDRTTLGTRRVSLNPQGGEGNSDSFEPRFSTNGRFLVFSSGASNLVAGDTNDTVDAFVRDLQTGTTTRVSVASGGAQANSESSTPVVSADGRYVAFASSATNLVAGDTNDRPDIFVRDRQTQTTTRVSLTSSGQQLTGSALEPEISADGRHVVFTLDIFAVYVHDRQSGTTRQVNVDSQGNPGTGITGHRAVSSQPVISGDGRWIAFLSGNTNLVPGDTNRENDIFLRDTQLGTTTRISVDSQGNQSTPRPPIISDLFDLGSHSPAFSANGRFVTFTSHATNLIADDFNGEPDIFLRDLQSSTTTRVSVDSDEQPLRTDDSDFPQFLRGSVASAVSADGRFVAFISSADFLFGDSNREFDIFLRDRQAGTTILASRGISRSSTPTGGAFVTRHGNSLSHDARYVTFSSRSGGLVQNDTNGLEDVFVRDRASGFTRRISVTAAGAEANGTSHTPSISRNGRYIVFSTEAPNLAAGAGLATPALMIHDFSTRTTSLINRNADLGTLSDDGRFVAFASPEALVPADRNGFQDVYVRDRQSGTTERVSARADGSDLNQPSVFSFISGNGRYVAFLTTASDLPPGTGGSNSLYLYDRTTRTTTFIARDASMPFVDVQGRYIAFVSSAPDLVPGVVGAVGDVFVYDRVTRNFARMNEITNGGRGGLTGATTPSISGDGRYVAFQSFDFLASDGVVDSFNLYVRDRLTAATTRAVQPPVNAGSFPPDLGSISGDGKVIVFMSHATTLVSADLNGERDVFLATVPKFPTVLRINAGGAAYVDVMGREWAADRSFNTGLTRRVSNIITNTRDSSLYQDERYDASEAPDLVYSLTVPNGHYLLRLHFAETFPLNFAVGKRVFDLNIEGTRRFSRLDVFAEAGALRALIKGSTANVTDGRLDVSFGRRVNNPTIAAIEIIQQ